MDCSNHDLLGISNDFDRVRADDRTTYASLLHVSLLPRGCGWKQCSYFGLQRARRGLHRDQQVLRVRAPLEAEGIFARQGFKIWRAAQSVWCGAVADLVEPLYQTCSSSLRGGTG